ncbi:MAG: hypothetical protein EA370_15145 [Wenzhouxiangella sp.]|nr:MAG: hypothetical protein EA370_15145 [Wenzhouxiangella sp.]
MLYVVVFIALLLIPIRFFYLNRYFFTLNISEAFATYKEREDKGKLLDSFLALFFIIGMGTLAAVAT